MPACSCNVLSMRLSCRKLNRWVYFWSSYPQRCSIIYMLPCIPLWNCSMSKLKLKKAVRFVAQNSVQCFNSFISAIPSPICPYQCCFSYVVPIPCWPSASVFCSWYSLSKIPSRPICWVVGHSSPFKKAFFFLLLVALSQIPLPCLPKRLRWNAALRVKKEKDLSISILFVFLFFNLTNWLRSSQWRNKISWRALLTSEWMK